MTNDMFFHEVTNAFNHRILLRMALEETKGSTLPILAMGIDVETTRMLHDYCRDNGRLLVSMDEDIFTVFKLREMECRTHEVVCAAWEVAPIAARGPWSVAVMNHAPGERRKDDAMTLKDRCEIIVMHDTEPNADRGYQFSTIWPHFRWRVDVKSEGAWASAVSNSRNLVPWRGQRVPPYVISMGDDDTVEDEVSVKIDRMFEERSEA